MIILNPGERAGMSFPSTSFIPYEYLSTHNIKEAEVAAQHSINTRKKKILSPHLSKQKQPTKRA